MPARRGSGCCCCAARRNVYDWYSLQVKGQTDPIKQGFFECRAHSGVLAAGCMAAPQPCPLA